MGDSGAHSWELHEWVAFWFLLRSGSRESVGVAGEYLGSRQSLGVISVDLCMYRLSLRAVAPPDWYFSLKDISQDPSIKDPGPGGLDLNFVFDFNSCPTNALRVS